MKVTIELTIPSNVIDSGEEAGMTEEQIKKEYGYIASGIVEYYEHEVDEQWEEVCEDHRE
jgi:hypothetical protein